MLYEVNIWGKELKCDVCSNNKWFKSIIRTDIQSEENTFEYNDEVRYMFECEKCGNCKLFGMVSSKDDLDDVNISICPISNI